MRGDLDASFTNILKSILSGWTKSHTSGTFPNVTSCMDRYHSSLPGHLLALHRSWEFIHTPYSVPGNVMRKKAGRTYTLVILSRTRWREEYLWNVSVQEIHTAQQKITSCEFQQHFSRYRQWLFFMFGSVLSQVMQELEMHFSQTHHIWPPFE